MAVSSRTVHFSQFQRIHMKPLGIQMTDECKKNIPTFNVLKTTLINLLGVKKMLFF